jgi:DNA processing protein
MDEEQPSLDPDALIEQAIRDLDAWREHGIAAHTVLDATYPANLRTVHDRPPVLFTRGVTDSAERALAIIGSREASVKSLCQAGDITEALKPLNYVAISGLARGVDAAVHRAALAAGLRTDAVVGTGLVHTYPPDHVPLQREIEKQGLVLSRFWPDTPPRPEQFPVRNALMSGLSRGTLVIAAGPRSGTRIQARSALAHGRPVFLHQDTMHEAWTSELSAQPNVHVVSSADEIVAVLEGIHGDG